MKKNIQTIIESSVPAISVICLSGVVYLAAYLYEVAYLVNNSISNSAASQLVEIRLSTYITMFITLVTVGAVMSPFVIVAEKSKRIKSIFKGTKGAVAVILLLLTLLIAQILLTKVIKVNKDSIWFTLLAMLSTLILIVNSIFYVVQNFDLKSYKLIVNSKAPLYLQVCTLIVGIYVAFTGFSWTAGGLGKFSAAYDRPLPHVKIDDTEYILVRNYGDRLILIEKDDDPDFPVVKVMSTGGLHYEYLPKN